MSSRATMVVSVLLFTRCATVFNGRNQRVSVRSQPAGAAVQVDCAGLHDQSDHIPVMSPIGLLFAAGLFRSGGGVVNRLAAAGSALFFFTPIAPAIDNATGASYVQYPRTVVIHLERQ